MKLSLGQKINGSILITFFIAAIAFSLVLIPLQNRRIDNAISESISLLTILMDREAGPMANALFEGRIRALHIRLNDILDHDGMLSLTVWNNTGQVISHIDRLGGKPENHDEHTHAYSTGYHAHKKLWRNVPSLCFEAPIIAANETFGFIQIVYSLAKIEKERRLAYVSYWGLLGAILLVMLLFMNFLLSAIIRKPIKTLQNAITKVQSEGPGITVPVSSKDEIGNLTSEFNRMSYELNDLLKRLQIEVDDRRGAENALRESEFRFRSHVNSSPEGILFFDLTANLVDSNKSVSTITGYAIEDLMGKHYEKLLSEESRLTIQNTLESYRRGFYKDRPLEIDIMKKDGTTAWLQTRLWLTTNQDNTPAAFGAFIRDITKEKSLAKEKKMLEDQLIRTQKIEAIGTLAGGIAHDFNNILSGIMGNTELALMTVGDTDEKLKKYLYRSLDASNRARELVQQILKFSRKEASTLGSTPLKTLLKEAIKLSRSTLPSTITIRESFSTEKDTVMGDATQLHQVFMNLFVNAYHAMKKSGGTLSIGLQNIELEEARSSSGEEYPPGNYVLLTVEDTGTGIEPDVMDRIFDPYFTTKKAEEGTGLGLAVTFGVIKNHRGFIEVESTPGKGSMFSIYLPSSISKSNKMTTQQDDLPNGNHEKLLVVDDEEFFLEVIQETLKSLNYNVSAHISSPKALELFQSKPLDFDAVITDQTMPEMTGIQLISEIRQINKEIPIILCTGYSDEVTEDSSKRYQVNRLMYKPISRDKLAKTVHEVLKKSGE